MANSDLGREKASSSKLAWAPKMPDMIRIQLLAPHVEVHSNPDAVHLTLILTGSIIASSCVSLTVSEVIFQASVLRVLAPKPWVQAPNHKKFFGAPGKRSNGGVNERFKLRKAVHFRLTNCESSLQMQHSQKCCSKY